VSKSDSGWETERRWSLMRIEDKPVEDKPMIEDKPA
jgi:hypothetical protein